MFNSPEIPFFPVSNYNCVSLCISTEASAGQFSFQPHPRLIVFVGCCIGANVPSVWALALSRLNHLNVWCQWSVPNICRCSDGRIELLWESSRLFTPQKFILFLTLVSNWVNSKSKRKSFFDLFQILVHVGFLTEESGDVFSPKVLKGGPLGEMVQWADILTALHVLGHNLKISVSLKELHGWVWYRRQLFLELREETSSLVMPLCIKTRYSWAAAPCSPFAHHWPGWDKLSLLLLPASAPGARQHLSSLCTSFLPQLTNSGAITCTLLVITSVRPYVPHTPT